LAINTNYCRTKVATTDLMRSVIKTQRYRLKKTYFNGVPANEIRTTSPVRYMSDGEWSALVAKWSDPKNMVWVSCHIFLIHYQFAKYLNLNMSYHLACSISCRKHVKRTSTTAIKSSIIRLRVLAAMWHTYMHM
jgi:hypothetical protein